MKTPAFALLLSIPLCAVTLTSNGRSDYAICTAPQAPAPDQRAASEIQRFLEEMSGARLAITSDCRAARKYVYLGAASKIDTHSFGPEEFVLETQAGNIIITGGAPRGTLYGVYTFLDRLGCRWFTSSISRIPKRPTIEIDSLDVREKPAFEYREPFFTEAYELDWAARNRTNGNSSKLDASTGGKVEYFPFVHSFNSLVPPEKYFKDHPEYFSLIDGARRSERSQLCLTNPAVLRIAIEQVRAWIREHPTAKIISVSQNDWEGWCECDRCRRVEDEEGGRHSGPILRFVNAVAAEIGKSNPDKLIDTLAYWYTEDPPAKVRPRPNVRIRLCPIGVCEAHPYEQCPRSAYFVRNLKAWSQITNQLYIWHYNTNFTHYLSPFPDFDELAADIPLYQHNGVVGLFMQGAYAPGGGGENAELRSYVLARLLWNPSIDVNHEINDFLDAVYGPAAQPIRLYFDRLHREVRLQPQGAGQHIWIFNLPDFSPSFLADAKPLLKQALDASASDENLRRRVERAALPTEYVELIQARAYHVKGDNYAPDNLEAWQTRFRAFATRLRTFGIQSIREGRMIEEEVKSADQLHPYRVFPLENDQWRVAIVPELSGRIVRMISKRTGQDVLRAPKPGESSYPNLGGQIVQAFPDFPLRAWDTNWTAATSHAGEVSMEGDCPNGIHLTRRIRLDNEWIRTEVTAHNTSKESIELVLQSRADLEPGDIDAARIRYTSASGAFVDKPVLVQGDQPNGSETKKGTDVPRAAWTLNQITNRFTPEQTERTTLSWTAKGGPRITLGVWSRKQILKPGESLSLQSDYR